MKTMEVIAFCRVVIIWPLHTHRHEIGHDGKCGLVPRSVVDVATAAHCGGNIVLDCRQQGCTHAPSEHQMNTLCTPSVPQTSVPQTRRDVLPVVLTKDLHRRSCSANHNFPLEPAEIC